jgi:HAMP domain-containing protein
MSAPRLILKQPTGWFAAGREFTQAITILSDGAFKLYVHACLMANRHTGRLSATVDELARAMTRAPTAVALNLDELEALAVCRMVRSGGSQLVIEISDRFWPYQKQQTPLCAPEPEAEFVQKVRGLFLARACVHASFSAADEKIAASLHRRGVPLEKVTRAILLGCARKYVAMINAGVRTPITSLQYFADIVEEVNESAIPESYWEPLRAKVVRMEQQWQNAHPARP